MHNRAALALFFAAVSLAQPTLREPALPAFHAQSNLVMVPFQVDRSSLNAADVVLLEDGAPRAFTVFQAPQDHPVIELEILFDISSQPVRRDVRMHTTYDFLAHWDEAMCRAILAASGAEIRASLYHMDFVQLARLSRPTADPKELLAAVQQLLAPIATPNMTADQRAAIATVPIRGGTPAGDAIPLELPPGREIPRQDVLFATGPWSWPFEAAIGTLQDASAAPDKTFRMLVVFSEGLGSTTTSPSDVADVAESLGVPVYPVVFHYLMRAPIRGGDLEITRFGELGRLTGGLRFNAPMILNASDVRDILQAVKNEGLARARSQYSVGFVPTSSPQPRQHKLEIKLAPNAAGKLTGGKRNVID